MRLLTWLSGVRQRLWIRHVSKRNRRRANTLFESKAMIEVLETRQLLTVGAAAVGIETRVNSYSPGTQDNPSIGMNASGTYVVTWASTGEDGSGTGIYAQRYSAAGVAQGNEFKVNTFTTGNQDDPTVAIDSAGDFVIAWQSAGQGGNVNAVFAQRFDSAGVNQGSEFKVSTSSNAEAPSVAMDVLGNFTIAYESLGQDAASSWGVYAKRFNAAGIIQGAEFNVNTYTIGAQFSPSASMDAAGDLLIAWDSSGQDGGSDGIYAQRYNSAGVAKGNEFRVNSYTTGAQQRPATAMDSAGDIVITWNSNGQDGDSYGVYAQRYNPSGIAQGTEFRVNSETTGAQYTPSVAMDNAGDFVITWHNYHSAASDYDIYAQRYNSLGTAQGNEFRVNTYTASAQWQSRVGMDNAGDFVVAWRSTDQDFGSDGIYSQRYLATIGPLVTDVLEVTGPHVVMNGDKLTTSITSMTCLFSDDMNAVMGGPHSVTNPANWQLFRYGVDVSNQIAGILYSYNSNLNRYQAVVVFKQPLAEGLYHMVAKQAIQDMNGRVLDGNADGIAGGDFYRNFAVANTYVAGSETHINTYTTSNQVVPAVATDAVGNYVMTWSSNGQDGSSYGIYAQRFNRSGKALSPEFKVNTITMDLQYNPAIAMDAAGDFVISWGGDPGPYGGLFAQRYNAAGVPQGTQFTVHSFTTNNEYNFSSIAMDAAGDFVIGWQNAGQVGSGEDVYVQRYSAAGIALGGVIQANSSTAGDQTFAKVAMDSVGNFVVTWTSQIASGRFIEARWFDRAGIARGSEIQVGNDDTGEYQSVAMNAKGDSVICWSALGPNGLPLNIYAQRYGADGLARGNEFLVNTFTTGVQDQSQVAMDAAGNFVVTWASSGQDGSGQGVYLQRYSANGNAQSTEQRVNTYTTSDQWNPDVAMDASGDFVIGWASNGEDGSGFGIYAQRDLTDVAPWLSGVEAMPLVAKASDYTPVTSTIGVFDQDDTTFTSATIKISGNYVMNQDLLSFQNLGNITGTWNAATGTLTLSGTDTLSNYRAALRSVTYHNLSGRPNTLLTRTLDFQVFDGLLYSNHLTRQVTVTT